MTKKYKTKSLVFHAAFGPDSLFDRVRQQLEATSTLDVVVPHAHDRIQERQIPTEHLTDFTPGEWEIVSVETSPHGGRIRYITIRRPKRNRKAWLWVVISGTLVITAYYRFNDSTWIENPRIVREGAEWRRVERSSRIIPIEEAHRRLRLERRGNAAPDIDNPGDGIPMEPPHQC